MVGSNARSLALLVALLEVIEDFDQTLVADFTRTTQEAITYLNSCRPSALAMQNIMKHITWQMESFESLTFDKEVK